MVHYLYFFQVFLLNVLIHAYTFPDTDLNKGVSQIVRRNSVKNDSVFVDVLKNITRVNGVLEDLILNYEKLQKIYKSQESLTELSSEDDADGRLQYNKKSRASLVQTVKPTFYSTQMFFSEEDPSLVNSKPEDEQSVEDIKNHEEEKSVEDNKKPQEEQSLEDNKKSQEKHLAEDNKKPEEELTVGDNKKSQEKQLARDNKKPEEEQTVGDNKKSHVMQIVIKDNNTTNEKYLKKLNNNNKVKKKQSVAYEDSYEVSETDDEQQTVTSSSYENYEEILAKKITNNNKNIPNETDKRIKILNNKTLKAAMPVTVEIPIAHLEPLRSKPDAEKMPTFQEPLKDTKKPNEITTQKTQPHTYKKTIIKTEEFRNKAIWDTISENKPVHLKTEREIIYSKRLGHGGAVFGRKSDMGPSLLKSTSEEKRNIIKKEGKELSSASVENDKLISKEQFKTRILREAYGDACLKLVVRKCYKACKEAGRKACQERRCQTITKEEFKRHSKTGCIKEFEAKSENLRKVGDGKEIEAKITDDFHDITRNGYLAAVCSPPLRSNDSDNAKQMGNATVTKMTGETIELNILRAKYEKACRKSSRRKCLSACQYAIGKTYSSVKTYDSKQKIAFEKYCKKECYSAYKGYDTKKDTTLESTEGSDGSSSDSDSKSDSKSDNDSSDSDSSDSYSDEKKKLSNKTKTKAKTSKSSQHKKKTTTTEAPDDAADSSGSGGNSNSDEKKNLSKQTKTKAKTSKSKKVKKKSTSSKDKKKTTPTEDPGDSTDSSDSGDTRML